MFDVIEVILIVFNLVIFLILWRLFVVMAYIHDMVKFFILQKFLKGVKKWD